MSTVTGYGGSVGAQTAWAKRRAGTVSAGTLFTQRFFASDPNDAESLVWNDYFFPASSSVIGPDQWGQPFSNADKSIISKTARVALIASDKSLDPLPLVSPGGIGPDGWLLAFSEPIWSRRSLATASQQSVPGSGVEDATIEARWHQPWSQPYLTTTRQSTIAAIASGQRFDPYPLGSPEPIFPDKWWQALREPKRFPASLLAALQQTTAQSESAEFPEVVYVDKYLYPFGEPKTFPARLHAAFNPEPAGQGIEDATIEARWHQPWSQPYLTTTRQSTIAAIASGQRFDPYPLGSPEPIFPDKWWQALGEPKRFPASLLAALQQTTAQSESAEFPEVVYVDKYLYPFSQPYLTKARQAAISVMASGERRDVFPLDQPEFTGPVWLQPFGEPRRFRNGSDRTLPQNTDGVVFPQPNESVTLDKYWQPFGEPKRFAKRLDTAAQPSFASEYRPKLPQFMAWHRSLDEPRRFRQRLQPAQQPAYVADLVPKVPAFVAWHRPFSEPRRSRAPMRIGPQPSLIIRADAAGAYARGYVIC